MIRLLVIFAFLAPQALAAMTRAAAVEAAVRDVALARPAAEQTAAMVRRNSARFRELGFVSADAAARAQLARGFKVYFVRLDALRSYDGSDPAMLLTDSGEVTYVLRVDDKDTSTATFERTEKGWNAVGFGEHRLKAAMDVDKLPGTLVLVEVPALNIAFVGRITGTLFELAALVDERQLDLRAATFVPAATVFGRLKSVAQNVAVEEPN